MINSTASACVSSQQTVSGTNTKALGLADTNSGTQHADATIMQGLGSAFLVIGGVGLVGLTYTGYQAHQREVIEAARVQAEEKAKIATSADEFEAIVRTTYATIDYKVDDLPHTEDISINEKTLEKSPLTVNQKILVVKQIQEKTEFLYEALQSVPGVADSRVTVEGGVVDRGTFLTQPPPEYPLKKMGDYKVRLATILFGDVTNLEKKPEKIYLNQKEVTLSYSHEDSKLHIDPPSEKTDIFLNALQKEREIRLKLFVLGAVDKPLRAHLENTSGIPETKLRQILHPDTKIEIEKLTPSLGEKLQDIAKKSAGESVLEVGTTVLLGAMLIVGAVLVGVGSSLADAATPETTLLQTLDTWIPLLETKFTAYSQAQAALALAISHTGS